MKKSIYIILIFLLGCENSENEKKEIVKVENQEIEFLQDTILERNNPNSLDLTKHQIFIDTTRKSEFYEYLINWKPDKYDINPAETYIKELNKISKYKKVDFGNFPRLFVKINKLEDEFYLYDRCDGIDPRFELRDSAFIFYGPLESDAETIKKVIQINNKGIKLELNAFKAKTQTEFSNLEILKTEFKGIYLMKYKNENYDREVFLIPTKDILKYDLVVNNCPNMKMHEYEPFY